MAGARAFKRQLGELTRGIKRTLDAAQTAADDSGSGGQNVNVARRANVVVAGNVGQDGGSHTASSHQRVRIKQTGGRTTTESETHETRLEEGRS